MGYFKKGEVGAMQSFDITTVKRHTKFFKQNFQINNLTNPTT
jgi:hypothetical protein